MLKDIKDLYEKNYVNEKIIIEGWIKNHRKQKEIGFIDFYDGTYFKSLQVIYDNKLTDFLNIQKIKIGSSVKIEGTLIESPKEYQEFELSLEKIEVLGDCPEDYPIQPKRHSREFLREMEHLRVRTNLFQAVFRIRSIASFAIHEYFRKNNYVYLHSPIITASDCEGAGNMFQVTTLELNKLKGAVDYTKDFFGKKAALTVSGQLQAEPFALAFKKVYTFGPTFRAENSHTKTHASEFWMIEPEIAFCDLNQLINIQEDFFKYIIKYVLDNCKEEYEFLNKYVEEGISDRLNTILNSKFNRISHKEAVNILLNSKEKFENKIDYNSDLSKEHEKYLTDNHFNSPVFVTDWPKDIKAFYMRLNNDKETVAAVDLLVPLSGEVMGGSQREERYDYLVKMMDEKNVIKDDLKWYMDLRKYGGVVHSGFGMGFERFVMYVTGIENIRDVIPYPRTPKSCRI